MALSNTSRRQFLLTTASLTSLGFMATGRPASQALTVGQVVARIKANVGIPWREKTVDNLIAGQLDRPVTGIATTMMATLGLLQRAAAQNLNLIITHESTFFTHQDRTDTLQDDALYQLKRDFIEKNNLNVFHFHDHWHGRQPDGIATGLIRALGWEQNVHPQTPKLFTFPETSLAAFAQRIAQRLTVRTMRVVGDPDLPVRRVMASWGNVSLFPGIPYLAQADVLVVGETHEWELVEYVQDAIAAGQKKALIILGHVVSEQAGMAYCADWLKTFISEIPIQFLAIDEPFWLPAQPPKK